MHQRSLRGLKTSPVPFSLQQPQAPILKGADERRRRTQRLELRQSATAVLPLRTRRARGSTAFRK